MYFKWMTCKIWTLIDMWVTCRKLSHLGLQEANQVSESTVTLWHTLNSNRTESSHNQCRPIPSGSALRSLRWRKQPFKPHWLLWHKIHSLQIWRVAQTLVKLTSWQGLHHDSPLELQKLFWSETGCMSRSHQSEFNSNNTSQLADWRWTSFIQLILNWKQFMQSVQSPLRFRLALACGGRNTSSTQQITKIILSDSEWRMNHSKTQQCLQYLQNSFIGLLLGLRSEFLACGRDNSGMSNVERCNWFIEQNMNLLRQIGVDRWTTEWQLKNIWVTCKPNHELQRTTLFMWINCAPTHNKINTMWKLFPKPDSTWIFWWNNLLGPLSLTVCVSSVF